MNTFQIDQRELRGRNLSFGDDDLIVELADGRTVTVPLAWFPRLFHATPAERANWRWIGGGIGMHWPELDEDIAVEGLMLGRPSGEGPQSLRRWLEQRPATTCPPDEIAAESRPCLAEIRPDDYLVTPGERFLADKPSNALVYGLFGLTAEEIAIVEGL